MNYIEKGSKKFQKANIALFFGGFVTFAILYCTQPLLPIIAKEYNISPATSSLSISFATGALSISMLFSSIISEHLGRKKIMAFCLIATSFLALLSSQVHNYYLFLLLRTIQGALLAGFPPIAMTYISEEFAKNCLGISMGLYVSGNTLGGMTGRIITSTLTDLFSWKIALGTLSFICIVLSILFMKLLPSSLHFQKKKTNTKESLITLLYPFRSIRLIKLFCIGFLLMGCFVSMYNYISFLLMAPPYQLSQTFIGWIFVIYLMGTFSSTWMGAKADQIGQKKVILISIFITLVGVSLTLLNHIIFIILGLATFTFGFFGAHSTASRWVSETGGEHKAQASSLYLFFYYGGSSILGAVAGISWQQFHWMGVFLMMFVSLSIAFILVLSSSNKKHK